MAANIGEEDEGAICRICSVGDEEKALIKVCRCKGSVEFVHQDCIDEWVNRSKKLLCICGYRMTLQREKLQQTMYEKYDKSFVEVFKELPRREYDKALILGVTFLCVSAMILLFVVSGLILDQENLMRWLMEWSSGCVVFWSIFIIDFNVLFEFLKLWLPQLLRKMQQDRYKLVVKAIR